MIENGVILFRSMIETIKTSSSSKELMQSAVRLFVIDLLSDKLLKQQEQHIQE